MFNFAHFKILKLLKQNTFIYQIGKYQKNLIKTRVSKGIRYLNDVSYMCTKMYRQEYSLQINHNTKDWKQPKCPSILE